MLYLLTGIGQECILRAAWEGHEARGWQGREASAGMDFYALRSQAASRSIRDTVKTARGLRRTIFKERILRRLAPPTSAGKAKAEDEHRYRAEPPG